MLEISQIGNQLEYREDGKVFRVGNGRIDVGNVEEVARGVWNIGPQREGYFVAGDFYGEKRGKSWEVRFKGQKFWLIVADKGSLFVNTMGWFHLETREFPRWRPLIESEWQIREAVYIRAEGDSIEFCIERTNSFHYVRAMYDTSLATLI